MGDELGVVTGTGSDVGGGGLRACQSLATVRKSSARRELGTERIRRAYEGPAERSPAYAPSNVKNPRLLYRRTGGSGGRLRRTVFDRRKLMLVVPVTSCV